MLLLMPVAFAEEALYYLGHGSTEDEAHRAFDDAAVAAGASAVVEASSWPSDLSPYHLIMLISPTRDFSASEVADLQAAHDRGDVVVMVSDASGGITPAVDKLRSDLGLSSEFSSGALDSTCTHEATVSATHAITTGLSTVSYAYSSEITAGGAGITLLTGESGQGLLVEEDGWVLGSDFNMFDDACTWAGDNITLIANLWTFNLCDGLDNDGDGYLPEACGDLDCDDDDVDVSPDAVEHCDGVDEDCDGAVDNDPEDADLWYFDADGDGFGDPATETALCEATDGYVDNAYDCDDTDANARPFADEVCDDKDQDCDGEIDEEAIDGGTFYADADGDGFGDPTVSITACDGLDGYVADATDCDDTDALRAPGLAEVCDERDNNCDGEVDDGLTIPTWYADQDGDGVGDDSTEVEACAAPAGHVADGGDCDDDDASLAADCTVDTGKASDPGCGCASAPPSALWLGLLIGLRRRATRS